jgi:hypothetical protein
MHGCETWSLILREECMVKVLEKRVLRIFGSKEKLMIGNYRKILNEKKFHKHMTNHT